jgi:hypothetical protein
MGCFMRNLLLPEKTYAKTPLCRVPNKFLNPFNQRAGVLTAALRFPKKFNGATTPQTESDPILTRVSAQNFFGKARTQQGSSWNRVLLAFL